jgi:hypothetical protein
MTLTGSSQLMYYSIVAIIFAYLVMMSFEGGGGEEGGKIKGHFAGKRVHYNGSIDNSFNFLCFRLESTFQV